jgi:PAS domain S-box-containing protein
MRADEVERVQAILVRGQRSVLELIGAGAPLSSVLSSLCSLVEEACPGTLCSVLLLTEDRLHLTHGAAPSLPAEYCRIIDGLAIDPPVGSCGSAAYTRAPAIVTDTATDPLWRGYEGIAATFGLGSCASTPILGPSPEGARARLLGTFAIYHASAGPYDAVELELLMAISDLAAIAILSHGREGALRDSEGRLARAAARSHVIEAHASLDGRWFRVPPALCTLLGRTEVSLLDTRLQDVIHPDDLEADQAQYQRLVRGEIRAVSLESRLLRDDGAPIWACLEASLVRDAEGKPKHLSLYVTDISEKKQTEEMLRTSQKMESLGALAGGLGHDLNNLLTAILCNVNIAQLEVDHDSPAGLALGDTEVVVRRAADLTRQMLSYAGKRRVVKRQVDLNQVVREMMRILSSSFLAKTNVELDLAPDLPAVNGDAAQVHQVLLNLVINAAQAIGDDVGAIRVRTRACTLSDEDVVARFAGQQIAPGEHVMIEVTDTGCGMSPEILEQIFDPFFTTKPNGRGLGLAVLRGILREHRAGLEVSSTPGSGTTFRISFPASQARVARAAVRGDADWPTARGTVLVADDEVVIRSAVAQMLRALGFDVVEATDSQDALVQLMKRTDVSLVLLDLSMPRLKAEDALLVIRERWPALRVVVTTSGHESDVVDRVAKASGVAVLQKPFSLLDLKRAVFGEAPENASTSSRGTDPRAHAPS